MSIEAVCPRCRKTYSVPEFTAGKTVKCKKCNTSFTVPVADQADDDALLDELIDDPAGDRESDDPSTSTVFHSEKSARRPPRRADTGGTRGTPRKAGSARNFKWIYILLGGTGAVLIACCGGIYFLFSLTKPPPASPQASEPFPLEMVKIPVFPDLPPPQTIPQTEVVMHQIDLGAANPGNLQPAARTQLRVYLPAGEHAARSLGCVLVGPAGTNLITGNNLDDPGYYTETLPYAIAGYVAVTYSLDGALPSGSDGSNTEDMATAYRDFSAASAGLANARTALEFVLARLPQVDPGRIFAAGHSSAGTLALLYAGHEPRLKGCIAYAPCSNVETHLGMMLRLVAASNQFPGIVDFAKRSSPVTHISRIKCPVFLFWALDDPVVDAAELQRFAVELGGVRRDAASRNVPTGGHFDAMVNPGIPQAIQWLRGLPGES